MSSWKLVQPVESLPVKLFLARAPLIHHFVLQQHPTELQDLPIVRVYEAHHLLRQLLQSMTLHQDTLILLKAQEYTSPALLEL